MSEKVVPLKAKPRKITVRLGLADVAFDAKSYSIATEPDRLLITKDDGSTVVIPWDQVNMVTDEPV